MCPLGPQMTAVSSPRIFILNISGEYLFIYSNTNFSSFPNRNSRVSPMIGHPKLPGGSEDGRMVLNQERFIGIGGRFGWDSNLKEKTCEEGEEGLQWERLTELGGGRGRRGVFVEGAAKQRRFVWGFFNFIFYYNKGILVTLKFKTMSF